MSTPTKKKAARKGGHLPLATPRKIIADLPWQKKIGAVYSGESNPEDESVAWSIILLRSYMARVIKEVPEDKVTDHFEAAGIIAYDPFDDVNHDSGGIAFGTLEEAQQIARIEVARLVGWMVEGNPDKLRSLARFIEARPLGRTKPAPADPAAAAAVMVANMGVRELLKKGETGETREDLLKLLEKVPAKVRDSWFNQIAPDTAKDSRQGVINEVFGIKKKPGRPKKRKSGS